MAITLPGNKENLAEWRQHLASYVELAQEALWMFFRPGRQKKESLVGVEFSSTYIKLLKLSRTGSQYQVDSLVIKETPSDAIFKLDIRNPVAIADTLKEMFAANKIKSPTIAIAIPRASAIIKNITLSDRLTDAELTSRVWIEASKLFPDLIQTIYLDFAVIGKSDKESGQLDILLVACRKDQIKPYLDIAQRADFKIKLIDLNHFAVERAIEKTIAATITEETYGVLNVSLTSMTLIVLSGRRHLYSHDQAFDGQTLKTFFNGSTMGTVTMNEERTQAILKSSLSLHLRHLMQFFYSSKPNIKIDKLYLCGDCALLPKIDQFIADEINVSVAILNPFDGMLLSKTIDPNILKRFAPALVLCCGLALSEY